MKLELYHNILLRPQAGTSPKGGHHAASCPPLEGVAFRPGEDALI